MRSQCDRTYRANAENDAPGPVRPWTAPSTSASMNQRTGAIGA